MLSKMDGLILRVSSRVGSYSLIGRNGNPKTTHALDYVRKA